MPLFEQYPAFYNIVRHKSDTIVKVIEDSPQNATFRRDLSGQWLVDWNVLPQCLANVHLQNRSDEFRWNLLENGKFSIESMYNVIIQLDVPIDNINIISFGR